MLLPKLPPALNSSFKKSFGHLNISSYKFLAFITLNWGKKIVIPNTCSAIHNAVK